MLKFMRHILIAWLLYVLVVPAGAQDLYLNTFSNGIYAVQSSTCTSVLIGNTTTFMVDIALHPDGTLYGLGGNTMIYSISTVNANDVPVAGITAINDVAVGLVCDYNGDMYAAGNYLWKLDWSTGIWTMLMNLAPYQAAGDITFYQGTMYMADVSQNLVKIDMVNQTVVSMGVMSTSSFVLGIVTVSNDVMDPCSGDTTSGGAVMFASSGTQLYEVDPTNAAVNTACGSVTSSTISGAASTAESSYQFGAVDLTIATPPNVFTPGFDGINDFFMLGIPEVACFTTNRMEIYDRWGVQVFSGEISDKWDGNAKNGSPCVTGTYYWSVHFKPQTGDEQVRTGFLTLIR